MIDEELFIAHVKRNNSGWDKPQKLEDHLYGVSALASSFRIFDRLTPSYLP